MEKQTSEEKNEPGIWDKTKKFFSRTEERETDKSEHKSMQPPYSYGSNKYVPDDVSNNQKLYFEQTDDTLLPCEFCLKEFPASELVLHETGCQPHLVSYAKPDKSEKSNPNIVGSRKNFVTKDSTSASKSQNTYAAGARSPFFTGNNSYLPSSRYEHVEQNRGLKDKAGEFLQSSYNQNSSKHQECFKRKENNGEEKKAEPLNFQSVWNAGIANDHRTEDEDSKQISDHADAIMDVDGTEETTNINKRHKEGMKEQNEVSENHCLVDTEITDLLKFLKGDENTESDEEFVSLSDEDGEPENSKIKVMDSKDNTQEKHFEDMLLTKTITIDQEFNKMCQETPKCCGNTEKNAENSSKHLADFQFGAHKSTTFFGKDNERYAVQSKKNEESKKNSKQKSSKCIESFENQKELVSSRHFADLRFGALKSTTSEDHAYCAPQPKCKYEEPEKSHKKNPSICIQRSKNQKEHEGSFRLIDLKLGRYESAALSTEDDVYEKNDEEPEKKCKQKSSKSIESPVNLMSKLLADFKLNVPESTFLSEKNAYCAAQPKNTYGESEKFFNEKTSKYIKGSDNQKEHGSSFRHLSDLKLGRYESAALSTEDDVYEQNDEEPQKICKQKSSKCIESPENQMKHFVNPRLLADIKFDVPESTTLSEKNAYCAAQPKNTYGESEKLFKEKTSKYIKGSENQKEDGGSFTNLADFKFGRYKSAALSAEDNGHQKDNEELDKLFKHNESFEDQRECFNSFKQLANFKLGANESTVLSGEKNDDKPDKLFKQKFSKSSDSINDGNESVSNHKFGTHALTTLCDEESYLKVLPEKNINEAENLYSPKISRYNDNTMDNKEYIRNFRQHLPDFKFGVLETKLKSPEDNVPNTLPEKKSSLHGQQAFKVEPDYHVSSRTTIDKTSKKLHIGASSYIDNTKNNNEKCVINISYTSDIKFRTHASPNEDSVSNEKSAFKLEPVMKKEEKVEGIEEKIAALQRKYKKHLKSVADEKDDATKWNKWRDMRPIHSSDSD